MIGHASRSALLFMITSVVVLSSIMAAPAPARAGGTSYTGMFTLDNDVQLETFTINSTSDVTLRTWSFLGGTNYAGQVISAGGFDPMLTLFGPGGGFIGFNDDIDRMSGNWDSELVQTGLAPGTYTVVLTQYYNYANAYLDYLNTGSTSGTLADGFSQAANPNFTLNIPNPPETSGYFWDAAQPAVERNGNWAMDIVTTASIPEPASLLLGGIGTLAGLGLVWKRRAKPAA
jgi:PEP-CTERM motif